MPLQCPRASSNEHATPKYRDQFLTRERILVIVLVRRERAGRLAVLALVAAVRARAHLGGRARGDRASAARAPARAHAEVAERRGDPRAHLRHGRDRAAGRAARARGRQRGDRERGRDAEARRRRALEARARPVPAACAVARLDLDRASTSRPGRRHAARRRQATCRARSRTRPSSRSRLLVTFFLLFFFLRDKWPHPRDAARPGAARARGDPRRSRTRCAT